MSGLLPVFCCNNSTLQISWCFPFAQLINQEAHFWPTRAQGLGVLQSDGLTTEPMWASYFTSIHSINATPEPTKCQHFFKSSNLNWLNHSAMPVRAPGTRDPVIKVPLPSAPRVQSGRDCYNTQGQLVQCSLKAIWLPIWKWAATPTP